MLKRWRLLLKENQLILFNMAAMGSIRFINVLESKHIDFRPQFAELTH